jgi:predicted DNA-binding transcriptional regulator AlpA
MRNLKLLRAQDVAEALSLSKRTVHRLNSAGKIPSPLRLNGAVRWKASDIQKWVDDDCPDRRTFEARRIGGQE